MPEEIYIAAIVLLLPITASMLVAQKNPYHALVIRGILGAVAALVYALFGAADVALTEALVGTMLSITLYAVAVRSSLSLRLGVLETAPPPEEKLRPLRQALSHHYLRLEIVDYASSTALKQALVSRDVHGIWPPNSRLQMRVQRLYQLLQTASLPLVYADGEELDPEEIGTKLSKAEGAQ